MDVIFEKTLGITCYPERDNMLNLTSYSNFENILHLTCDKMLDITCYHERDTMLNSTYNSHSERNVYSFSNLLFQFLKKYILKYNYIYNILNKTMNGNNINYFSNLDIWSQLFCWPHGLLVWRNTLYIFNKSTVSFTL